jgi:hypothetical protein
MFRAATTLEKLPGKTAIVVDNSGSMHGEHLSQRSEMTPADAAAGLTMLLREVCEDVDVIAFGQTAALVPPRRGFGLRDVIRAANVGHSTFVMAGKAIADARGYDRIIVVTDMQVHDHLDSPTTKGYILNVAAYKNAIGYGPWTRIDGWSENVVRYIAEAESANPG